MSISDSISNYRTIKEFDEIKLPGPPSREDVGRADAVSKRLCGHALPPLMHELWKSLPSIGADGTQIYPPVEIHEPAWVHGVVEANEAFPPPEGMVHVGRRDDDQLSWRAQDGHVFLTDVYSDEPMEVADSLEGYFDKVIASTLVETVELIREYKNKQQEK